MSRIATSLIGTAVLVLMAGGCVPFPGPTSATFVVGDNLQAETVLAAADFPSARKRFCSVRLSNVRPLSALS